MPEQGVDLKSIIGEWDYHARYVTNSMEQTLKRLHKYWRLLKRNAPCEGIVPVDGELLEEFIEACRQTRAICDDLMLIRETKPAAKRKRKDKSKSRNR